MNQLTAHLLRSPNTRLTAREKPSCRPRIPAQIKVYLSSILIRNVTDRIPINGTQVVNSDRNTILRHSISAQIRRHSKLVACSARRTCALAGARAELCLAQRGGVAAPGLSTGVDGGSAIGGAHGVALAVFGEGGFEGGGGEGEGEGESEEGFGEHGGRWVVRIVALSNCVCSLR